MRLKDKSGLTCRTALNVPRQHFLTFLRRCMFVTLARYYHIGSKLQVKNDDFRLASTMGNKLSIFGKFYIGSSLIIVWY